MSADFRRRVNFRRFALQPTWRRLVNFTTGRYALVIVIVAGGLWAFGFHKAKEIKIGDFHAGVPETAPVVALQSDTAVITSKFSIGADTITTLTETIPNGGHRPRRHGVD